MLKNSRRTIIGLVVLLFFMFLGTGLFAHKELGIRKFANTPQFRKLLYGAMPVKSKFILNGRGYVELEDGRVYSLMGPVPLTANPDTAEDIKKRNKFLAQLPPTRILPDKYLLKNVQTPIRDQDERGNCYMFGVIAGVEACYNRKTLMIGLQPKPDLDLSEQYLIQYYQTSLDGENQFGIKHENLGSYMHWDGGVANYVLEILKTDYIPIEDNQPRGRMDGSNWIPGPIGDGTTYRFGREMMYILEGIPSIPWERCGIVPGAWPISFPGFCNYPPVDLVTQEMIDDFEYSPTYMPWQAHSNCKYGIKDYIKLSSATVHPTTDQIEQTLYSNQEVIATIACWTEYDRIIDGNPAHVWDWDPASMNFSHIVLIVGYDHINQIFYFKNSWGGDSFTIMTYDLWNKMRGGPGASVITDVPDLNIEPQFRAKWLGHWYMDHDGHKGELIIRRLPGCICCADPKDWGQDALTKLGSYIDESGDVFQVNGKLAEDELGREDGRGLIYYIVPVSDSWPPKAGGQRFDVWNFSWEPNFAAGTTTWENMPFGVALSRDPIPGYPADPFDKNLWLGTWDMNHDGWHGKLTIKKLEPISEGGLNIIVVYGTYLDIYNGGILHTITGYLIRDQFWRLRFYIRYQEHTQPFDLYFHTWESNVFSGTTVWNGKTFGVIGIKKLALNPAAWVTNHRYLVGDKVTYKGATYQCTFEHVSLPGWEPDNPVMWNVWKKIG